MRRSKTNISLLILVSVLFSFGCNQPANTLENKDTDTIQVSSSVGSSTYEYDPALDPLKVACANGKLIHDSLGIKMYEVWVKPGESAPLHSHPDHAIYVLEGGKAMLYSKEIPGTENGLSVELKAGEGLINDPVSDSAEISEIQP